VNEWQKKDLMNNLAYWRVSSVAAGLIFSSGRNAILIYNIKQCRADI
jgi:hypothetical protein